MQQTHMPIDESKEFLPLRVGIATISDTRTHANDTSGDYLESSARNAGHSIVARKIIRDDQKGIESLFEAWAEEGVQAIISTGGTGITGRDNTPEAVQAVCNRMIPGFGELFRMLSYESVGTSTIQSRACAGMRGATLIFALPGSTGACRDAWEQILHFQLDSRHMPCNFATLFPRLVEQ